MNCGGEFYVRVCDCGRIHVENRHIRLSFHPAEFVALLRRTSGIESLNGVGAARHRRAFAEGRAMSSDSGAEKIIRYPFSQESVYGASSVD